ncbi:MAG: hypothetical protein Q9162_000494 [Coniocarpon cinnabarinum]
MSDKKSGMYGANTGSDTSFRKTWDREKYAKKAAERERKLKDEGRARYEAALEGKKYHKRASTPPDARETESRQSRLDVASQVGKQTLVPAGSAVGKRGKGAGFYCIDCDLTFKDNLQLVEHYNSRQHLINVGQSGEVKRATLEDVRERLAWLKRKKEEEEQEASVNDLDTRLGVRREREEQEREEKRRKRAEKRRKYRNEDEVEEYKLENGKCWHRQVDAFGRNGLTRNPDGIIC